MYKYKIKKVNESNFTIDTYIIKIKVKKCNKKDDLKTAILTFFVAYTSLIVTIVIVVVVVEFGFILGLFILAIVETIPDVGQTNGRVEPVEYGNGRAKSIYDAPLENAKVLDEIGFGVESLGRQRVEEPHGDVGEQQCGDELACWFAHERRVMGRVSP